MLWSIYFRDKFGQTNKINDDGDGSDDEEEEDNDHHYGGGFPLVTHAN